MAENTDRDALPQATIVPKRHSRISVIWIIPIFAALVAIGIAIQRVLSEGPTITIVLKAAEGIEAGKTFIKYKDVNIGLVSAVELSDDFTQVTATAKIAKHAAGLMVEDARFWVVSPRIGLGGVSGLSTLLSGNYIGFEAGKSSTRQRSFTALEVPPVVTGQAGRQFVLRSANIGSLGIGSPLYFRRLQAGQVMPTTWRRTASRSR
jgi:paraquat-inducible protein B